MSRILVSGLVNTETSTKVRGFPINYYPIDYAFFGVGTNAGGVGLNVAFALKALGDDAELYSLIGRDFGGKYVLSELQAHGISTGHIFPALCETPSSAVLFDGSGRRQVYCDLKDIQESECSFDAASIERADLVAATNINFSRPLLKLAKEAGKKIATDVHVLSNIEDEYNLEFMEAADILFLSHEGIGGDRSEFIKSLASRYDNELVVLGIGAEGALLYERGGNKLTAMPAYDIGGAVNTVGAGDALFSAFIHFYAKGMGPVESLERAQLFAAMKIRVSGAARGFPSERELEEKLGTLR